MRTVSKSQLKSQLLEFLRKVEKEKIPIIVTHGGKPVAKIFPYKENLDEVFKSLKGSAVFYKDPTLPVGEKDWETAK